MDSSMGRRCGVVLAAMPLVLMCLALISHAEAGRTHELFAQSTYAQPKTLVDVEEAATVGSEPLKVVDDDLPVKATTTTAQDSTISQPQEADPSIDVDPVHNPESARAQSTATLVDIPQQQQQQHHYKDYTGTTTFPQGDFKPDARPWWFNPQYASYVNYLQGRNPQLDQQQMNPDVPFMPNRYPMGYPNQYTGPQLFPSLSSNPGGIPQSFATVQGNAWQFPNAMQLQQQQQQYFQSRYPQYSGVVPPEMTAGGCPTQYWISNTQRWPAFFTVKTVVGDALGTPASKIFGETTLLQALLNTRPDGYSTLLRSAATAILNSYTRSQYKFSHVNVMESFADALSSSKAAAEQAASFEEANVSSYSEQYNSCV